MIAPTVIVFSHRKDQHLLAVLSHFAGSEVPFVVDLGDFGHSFAATVNPGNPRATTLRLHSGEAVSISRLKSVWWRGPTGTVVDPATPEHLRTFVDDERGLFLRGFLSCLPSGVRLYNNPQAHKLLESKLFQLHLAARVGLTIPATCITSDPAAARKFIRQHPRVVFKPVWGAVAFGRPTRLLTPEIQDKLDQVLVCPVIFQEFVAGDHDLRITVIDDEIRAVAFDIRNTRYPAYVLLNTRTPGQLWLLPPDLHDKLHEFMRQAGIRYGSFDFRQGPDGSITFLEVNPAGPFLYLDDQAGTRIAAGLAQALAREVEASSEPPPLPVEIADESGWPEVEPIPFAAFGSDIKHLI